MEGGWGLGVSLRLCGMRFGLRGQAGGIPIAHPPSPIPLSLVAFSPLFPPPPLFPATSLTVHGCVQGEVGPGECC